MYTILMVDDEENIRKALISSVDWNELGFEIIGEASNGIEALDLIEKLSPDLLVSDIKMPLMGGIELARAVRDVSPNIQMVFLSGYDHFKFAKEAIRYNILEYLVKPISPAEIKTEFTSIRERMDAKYGEILDVDTHIDVMKELQIVKKSLLFTNLMHSNISKEQAKKAFDDIEALIPFEVQQDNKFVICAVKSGVANADESTLKRMLNISNIVSKKYINCECMMYKGYVIIFGYGTEQELKKYMRILTKDIVLSAKRVMNMSLFIGQSENFTDIMQLGRAFSEARDAVSSIDNTDENIIAYSDILSVHEDFSLQEMVSKLEMKIRLEDVDSVKECINNIFQYISESKISPSEYTMSVLELQLMLLRAERQLDNSSEYNSQRKSPINISKSRSEMESEIKNFATELSIDISNQRKRNVDVLSESAQFIINSEYSNSLMSLSLLSERLHCSPNYLSGLIKKNIGKSFIDILTEARMIKAKELLLTTNKKIMEISDEVGYGDQHYFSYSFKKYFNISPNQMRKNEL